MSSKADNLKKAIGSINMLGFEPEILAELLAESNMSDTDTDDEDEGNPRKLDSAKAKSDEAEYSDLKNENTSKIAHVAPNIRPILPSLACYPDTGAVYDKEPIGKPGCTADLKKGSASQVVDASPNISSRLLSSEKTKPIGKRSSTTLGGLAKEILAESESETAKTTPAATRKIRRTAKAADQINIVKAEIESTKNEIAKLQEMMGGIADLRKVLFQNGEDVVDPQAPIPDFEQFKAILNAFSSDGASKSKQGCAK